jgi:hypothetical protein
MNAYAVVRSGDGGSRGSLFNGLGSSGCRALSNRAVGLCLFLDCLSNSYRFASLDCRDETAFSFRLELPTGDRAE